MPVRYFTPAMENRRAVPDLVARVGECDNKKTLCRFIPRMCWSAPPGKLHLHSIWRMPHAAVMLKRLCLSDFKSKTREMFTVCGVSNPSPASCKMISAPVWLTQSNGNRVKLIAGVTVVADVPHHCLISAMNSASSRLKISGCSKCGAWPARGMVAILAAGMACCSQLAVSGP